VRRRGAGAIQLLCAVLGSRCLAVLASLGWGRCSMAVRHWKPPRIGWAGASADRGLKLVFGCKWAYAPGQPTMFTRSFATDWCGVSDKTAWQGTQWLLLRHIIVPAGKHKGRPLYFPGAP
jgi:hypothetical protein